MKKKKVTCLKRLNRFSVLLLACLFVLQGHAKDNSSSTNGTIESIAQQDKAIEGKIVDETGLPLPGVSVLVKGTTTGTTTDFDGVFKLTVPNNATLDISYVGFISQQITIGDKTFFNISLKENVKALDEVVVVGYSTQRKADLTGSVSSVKMGNLNDMSVSGISSALQGRMSGVTVLQSSGAPGSGTSIRIRGMGTFGNNEPLYVIDGMPSDNMNDINPSDIERIDVLKDASSAAIYGSRAANGVVLIQTKKGGKSEKVNITFNTYHGIATTQRKIKLLNAQDRNAIHLEALGNAYGDGALSLKDYNDFASKYATDASQITQTKWLDEVFRDAAYQSNYDLSLNGGGQTFKYNVMAAHLAQDGTLKGTDFDRTTFRVNTEIEPIKGLKIGENLMITHSKRHDVGQMGPTGAIGTALLFDPSVPVRDDKGNYSGSGPLNADIRNPVGVVDRADRKDSRDRIFGNIYGSLNFLNDFTVRTEFGYDWTNSKNKWFSSRVPEAARPASNNELTEVGHKAMRWMNTNTLQYDKTIGKHKFLILGGTAYEEYRDDWSDARGTNFISEEKSQRYMSAATKIAWLQGGRDEWALLSYLGRLDYSFADKYLLSASFRADGSSKFRADNRWGYFPSVSGGWRVSEESFFQPLKENAIQNLKVRASWGQLGNQDIQGQAYPTYVIVRNTNDDDGYSVIFGENENVSIGRYESTYPDKNLKWETTTQTNIGLDVSFLNHWDLEFDYFIKKSKDVITQIPLPSLAGLSSNRIINAADVKNNGFEFNLSYNTQINQDFNIRAYGNFSRVRNEVTSMGSGSEARYPTQYRGNNITRITEGSAIGHFFGYKTDGIFRTQEEIDQYKSADGKLLQPNAKVGDLKFLDLNNDGVIDGKDTGEIGSGFPDFSYGFGADLDYKGFDLSFFFQGVAGYDIFNGLKYEGMFVDRSYNQFDQIKDRFHPVNNPGGDQPRVTIKDTNSNSRISDYYVDNGSYLRLKTLTLGYTLNKNISQKLRLQKIRLYATTQNLFTITSYKGFDPELGDTYANEPGSLRYSNELGVDRGQFPQPRTFIFGVNINF